MEVQGVVEGLAVALVEGLAAALVEAPVVEAGRRAMVATPAAMRAPCRAKTPVQAPLMVEKPTPAQGAQLPRHRRT